MLVRVYQFVGVMLLSWYACSSFLGWEFNNPVLVRTPPPVGANVSASSTSWAGRTTTHSYSGSSSGTRSGWGGISFGGK
ncbi:MAG: hypothetical protein U0840_06770 [Gemmataceae bacterium]